jgi:chemotaxis response regulator CheB
MPREAARLGAVEFVKPLQEIPETLLGLVSKPGSLTKKVS